MRTVDDWKRDLRDALRDAMRARDADTMAVLREVLAAIDNAEAADPSVAPPARSEVIAGAIDGLGAGDVPRVTLDPDDVLAVITGELTDRKEACEQYTAHGRDADARRLTRQIAVLDALIARD